MLDEKTFSLAPVGDLMKAFVNVKMNGGAGEGRDLAKRFHVNGFPTMLVTDADGGEIDRIVGYSPAESFMKEVQRILKGEGTLPALRKRAADAPDDLGAAIAFGRKLSDSAPEEAVKVLAAVVEKAKGKDRSVEAESLAALAGAARHARAAERAMTAYERVVTEFGDTDVAGEVAGEAVMAFLRADDAERALAFLAKARKVARNPRHAEAIDGFSAGLHVQAAAEAWKRQGAAAGDDPEALNQVAWACFEHHVNSTEAILWAAKAVEKSNRDPSMLDTLANLLFQRGQVEQALKLEEEAVATAKPEELKNDLEETLAKMKAVVEVRKARAAAKEAEHTPPDEKPAGDGK